MADKKISELNALTAVADVDLCVVVDDPTGSAETKKITRANLLGSETITIAAGKALKTDTISETTGAAGVTVDGGLLKDGAFEGVVEGKCIDVAQFSNNTIIDNDTNSLVFDFVPSKIVLSFSGGGKFTGVPNQGITTGHTIITITGTDTITSVCNATAYYQFDSAWVHTAALGDTVNVIYLYVGRMIATGSATILGTATWTTATKTLLITYQETFTDTSFTNLEVLATAYK